jgi:predicted DNA-binding WGR domain protein
MTSSMTATSDFQREVIQRGLDALHDEIHALYGWDRCQTRGHHPDGGTYVCSLKVGHRGGHLAFMGHSPLNHYCEVEAWRDGTCTEPRCQYSIGHTGGHRSDQGHTWTTEVTMPVTPYLLTMIEIVYIDHNKNHDKFYRAFLDHQTFEVRYQYGRNGFWNQGSFTDPKSFPSFDKANAAMMKQIQAKLRKGYAVQRSLTITCAKQPPLALLAQEVNRPLYQHNNAQMATSLVIANV